MNRDCTLLREPLEALRAGRMDGLTPDRIAALEAHLNTCQPCAEMVGAGQPMTAADPVQIAARRGPRPTMEQWDRAWGNIDEATAGASSIWLGGRRGILRRAWRPLACAAACVMMVGSLRLGLPLHRAAERWSVADAGSVDLLEFEVGDGVVAVAGNGPTVLWIIEPDEGDSS